MDHPPRSRGEAWEVCSGVRPQLRPRSGTRSGLAGRRAAAPPARRPCGAAAGSEASAASAGSARSGDARAGGATDATELLRRHARGFERDAADERRARESSVKRCASRLVSRLARSDALSRATLSGRPVECSSRPLSASRRRVAQPGAGAPRVGTTAPRGVLPSSSDSLFERRGREASARASQGGERARPRRVCAVDLVPSGS